MGGPGESWCSITPDGLRAGGFDASCCKFSALLAKGSVVCVGGLLPTRVEEMLAEGVWFAFVLAERWLDVRTGMESGAVSPPVGDCLCCAAGETAPAEADAPSCDCSMTPGICASKGRYAAMLGYIQCRFGLFIRYQ